MWRSFPRRASIWVLSAVLMAWSLPSLKEAYRWHRKFGVVKDGVLLRSQMPSVQKLEELTHRYGVKTIVSLLNAQDCATLAAHPAETEYAAGHNIRMVHLPIDLPAPTDVRRFFDIVDDQSNWPILLHCVHGTVRTGLLVAAYRMEKEGWSNRQALDEMVSFGFDTRLPDHQGMVDFVLEYRKSPCPRTASAPSLPYGSRSRTKDFLHRDNHRQE